MSFELSRKIIPFSERQNKPPKRKNLHYCNLYTQ